MKVRAHINGTCLKVEVRGEGAVGGRGQGEEEALVLQVHQTPPTLGLRPPAPPDPTVDSELAKTATPGWPCRLTLALWVSGTGARRGLKKQVRITLVPAPAATRQLCTGDHSGQSLRQVQVPPRGLILEKALGVNSPGFLS